MTPEQIAYATLRAQEFQAWVTAAAIFLGPLAGVVFTIWFQNRKEKQDAKHRLFIELMADRKAPYVSVQVAQALNKIDVVFADSSEIRKIWHEYYALLHQPAGEPRAHKWLELLKAIAQELGYKDLSQLDIDKFYVPQGHVDDAQFQREMGEQWARVLKNTEHFIVQARKDQNSKDQNQIANRSQ